ncbi:YhcH/YjgK/YiaL family protein [Seleniivibrio sp.]|uniref:YhcH/YjgK/YiaL family protein n=1 Tax=Seleniivibrio sp. TaxID=2898801 RepID=UPI0025F4FBD0|nr:YhcH/YjgK/YiaL family protein [Seleniivibrio sp.]MCD8554103.1 YhcH/YjgK/YiaL family protein [Seleniivibrio sp.]
MAIITVLDELIKNCPEETIKKYLLTLKDENSETVRRIKAFKPATFERFQITNDIFAIEQSFETKDRHLCFFESHKSYVDIQIMLGGREQMELCRIEKLETDVPYDAEKDLIKYKISDRASKLAFEKYDCAVYFPEDAHLCVAKLGETSTVYKTVLKVPVSYKDFFAAIVS